MKEGYAYDVARVHIKEEELLTQSEAERLLDTPTYQEAIQFLQEKGYAESREMEDMLSARREELWRFLRELSIDPQLLSIFRYETDFHNLKVAIKGKVSGDFQEKFFLDDGNVSVESIKKAAKDNDFTILPGKMAEAGKSALELLLRVQDGQLCDSILDRATLETIEGAGKQSEIPLIRDWAKWKVATTDIKIAVRCCLAEKSFDFILRALAECETLDCKQLATAAAKDLSAIYEYLSFTPYEGGVEVLKRSLSAFETWCDNVMMKRIRGEKVKYFTVAPVLAYVLAVENEIKQIRLILTGKRNGLHQTTIRERMRDLYD